jgi:hypothetical protein
LTVPRQRLTEHRRLSLPLFDMSRVGTTDSSRSRIRPKMTTAPEAGRHRAENGFLGILANVSRVQGTGPVSMSNMSEAMGYT